MKIRLRIAANHSRASFWTWLVMFVGILGVTFLPATFVTYPASLKSLVVSVTALFIFAFFLITIIRRRKFILNLSPLSGVLATLAVTICLSLLINHFFHPDKMLLGITGLLLSFIVISLLGGSLLRLINSQKFINILLVFSSFFAVTSLVVFAANYTATAPAFISVINNCYYSPTLSLSMIFLGIACIAANFFKKSKLKLNQLGFLPILIIGLMCTLALSQQTAALTPSHHDSLTVLINQLTKDNSFQWMYFLFGSPVPSYSDLYAQAAISTQNFNQAFNVPLTLATHFGIFTVLAWIALLIKTAILCFNKDQKNTQLYFVLLATLVWQFFTPFQPLILIIQALLIAASTDYRKKTILNFDFATILEKTDGQQVENYQQTRRIIPIVASLGALVIIFITFRLASSYLGFYHHQRALVGGANSDIETFYRQSIKAAKIAPHIDIFQRYASIANLELLAQATHQEKIDNTQLETYYQAAVDYAQNAISLDPHHADNYLTLAQAYQEIYPFADQESQAELNKKIPVNYSTASLLEPINTDYLLGLAGFYQSVAETDLALIIYQEALKIDPNSILTNFQLATLYQLRGETELARSTYTNALNLLDPNEANYTTNKQLIENKLTALDQ